MNSEAKNMVSVMFFKTTWHANASGYLYNCEWVVWRLKQIKTTLIQSLPTTAESRRSGRIVYICVTHQNSCMSSHAGLGPLADWILQLPALYEVPGWHPSLTHLLLVRFWHLVGSCQARTLHMQSLKSWNWNIALLFKRYEGKSPTRNVLSAYDLAFTNNYIAY